MLLRTTLVVTALLHVTHAQSPGKIHIEALRVVLLASPRAQTVALMRRCEARTSLISNSTAAQATPPHAWQPATQRLCLNLSRNTWTRAFWGSASSYKLARSTTPTFSLDLSAQTPMVRHNASSCALTCDRQRTTFHASATQAAYCKQAGCEWLALCKLHKCCKHAFGR